MISFTISILVAVALTFQNILYCSFGVFVGQIIVSCPHWCADPMRFCFLSPSRLSHFGHHHFAGIYYGVAYGYHHLGLDQRAPANPRR